MAADLAVDITDGGASVEAGGDVTYLVSYENRGDTAAADAKIHVDLPSGATLNAEASSEGWTCEEGRCTLELGEVAAEASGEANIAVTIPADTPDSVKQVRVWANIKTSSRDYRFRNNWDSSTTPIDRAYHDLRFDITDNGAKVAPGETVTYTASYKNRGDNAAVASTIMVTLPEGTSFSAEGSTEGWVCEGQTCTLNVGDVAPEAEGEATISVTVADELPADTRRVVVMGEISAEGADSNIRNNDDYSVTPLRTDSHDLKLRSTDNGADVAPGGTVAYAISYQNRGDSTAAGSVITTELPEHTMFSAEGSSEGWTCEGQTCTLTVGDVESGGSGEATLAVSVSSEVPDDVRYLKINSTISGEGTDKNTRNNSDPSYTPVTRPYQDLALKITDEGARTTAGGSVVYFIDYANRGNSVAAASSISVTLPENTTFNAEGSTEGWMCEDQTCTLVLGDVEAATTGKVQIAVSVAEDLANDIRSLRIEASIAGDGTEYRTRNNSDPSSTPIDRDYHDASVKITDNGAKVAAGGTVVYDVTYQNRASHAANAAVITVDLPESATFSADGSAEGWACEGQTCKLTVGDLEPGASGKSQIAVSLPEELPNNLSRLQVWATIQADGPDQSTRNNRERSITPVERDYHDLRMNFTDNGATVAAGGIVVYEATYKNRGESVAAGAAVTVELPEYATFVADQSSEGWTCEGKLCTLTVGDVAADVEGTAMIAIQVAEELPAELTRVDIVAAINASTGADSRLRDNRNGSVTPIEPADDVVAL